MSISFMKNIFIGYRILGWYLSILFHCFMNCFTFLEKSSVSFVALMKAMSPSTTQLLKFSLLFGNFSMMYLDKVYFVFIMLRVNSHSSNYDLIFTFIEFLASISSNIAFLPHFSVCISPKFTEKPNPQCDGSQGMGPLESD